MEKKKRNKIAWIIVVVVILILAVIGVLVGVVFANTPEKEVDKILTGFKNYDLTAIEGYTNSIDEFGVSEEEGDQYSEILKSFFSGLEWEITDSEIDGDTAKVKVTATNKDYSQFFQKMMSKAYSMIFSTMGTEEESNEIDLILSTINELTETKTVEEEITLNKVDGEWKIDTDEAFMNVLLPGLQEGMNNLYGTDDDTLNELQESADEVQQQTEALQQQQQMLESGLQ